MVTTATVFMYLYYKFVCCRTTTIGFPARVVACVRQSGSRIFVQSKRSIYTHIDYRVVWQPPRRFIISQFIDCKFVYKILHVLAYYEGL